MPIRGDYANGLDSFATREQHYTGCSSLCDIVLEARCGQPRSPCHVACSSLESGSQGVVALSVLIMPVILSQTVDAVTAYQTCELPSSQLRTCCDCAETRKVWRLVRRGVGCLLMFPEREQPMTWPKTKSMIDGILHCTLGHVRCIP